MRELLDVLTREIAGIEVELSVPVRDEVDAIADPHGIAFCAHGVGNGGRCEASQVEDVQVLRPASLISLPGSEIAKQG